MASPPANSSPQNRPRFLHKQLYAPPSPVTQTQHQQTNLHPQRSLSYPTPPPSLQSPRANNNGGGGRKGAVANQEPSIQLSFTNEIARLFQTRGGDKQAVQEPHRPGLESLVSELAHTLREISSSVSSLTEALILLVTQLSSLLEKVEAPIKTELSRFISEGKYEESFSSVLERGDDSMVSWLCSQVDLRGLVEMNPLRLSQGVLLALVKQLACDINKDSTRKIAWMTDVVAAIDPSDQMIAVHALPIFGQVFQILKDHSNAPGSDVTATRVVMLFIKSQTLSILNHGLH